MIKIASFNVENLFARPRVFNPLDWDEGKPILKAYEKVNSLFAKNTYTPEDKDNIRTLLLELDIYSRNSHGAIRRKRSISPRWAWLRKNRGSFDRQPRDNTKSVEFIARGRGDWLGWVTLAREATDESSTRMTARVIKDLNADIIAIIEAEDRPSLVKFNHELLGRLYKHIMLIDGNDKRGIDVGIMMGGEFRIESMRSNVDNRDATGIIFSRDCPQFEVHTPDGNTIHVLVNHFKSQSGGGGSKRRRQAAEVLRITTGLVAEGKHVVVLGDFNEGPHTGQNSPESLKVLFAANSPLVDCYSLTDFDVGNRPGTFNACGLRERLDYILISKSLKPHFESGGVFRKGLWGSRTTRPDKWDTYPEMTNSSQQASDHGAVYINLDI